MLAILKGEKTVPKNPKKTRVSKELLVPAFQRYTQHLLDILRLPLKKYFVKSFEEIEGKKKEKLTKKEDFQGLLIAYQKKLEGLIKDPNEDSVREVLKNVSNEESLYNIMKIIIVGNSRILASIRNEERANVPLEIKIPSLNEFISTCLSVTARKLFIYPSLVALTPFDSELSYSNKSFLLYTWIQESVEEALRSFEPIPAIVANYVPSGLAEETKKEEKKAPETPSKTKMAEDDDKDSSSSDNDDSDDDDEK